MSDTTEPTVVIVGAGPAGLALAIELGHRRIPCLLIEKTERGGHAPRAKTTHCRTREHLRRWGIADTLAAESPLGLEYPADIAFVTRLGGKMLHRFERVLDLTPGRCDDYAEHGQWIPQYRLEAVLRAHAMSLPGVAIRFGQEFTGFVQDGGGVRVATRDTATGAESTVAARYLVGADGARSAVRDAIGARMHGRYGLSRNLNIIFRAPGLEQAHPHGRAIMFWQVNDDVPSLIGPMDRGDLWFFMPTRIEAGRSLSPAEAEAMIRRATGLDTPIEVLSADEWVASSLLADRYRRGRVFLAGDACHLHPPFGGFGMLLGIGDSVDLGWKIAAVEQGWGGPVLLDSYEPERARVHRVVIDAAESNHTILANQLVLPELEADSPAGEAARAQAGALIRQHKSAEFYARGIVLGCCLTGSPVIRDDGTQADWAPALDYRPTATPGCRAPHRWLSDSVSLYDRFGPGFTLLATEPGAEADIAAARAEAGPVPLTVLDLPDAGLRPLYGARLALIRPDQHVAWRGDTWPTDAGLFAQVTGHRQVVSA